MAKGDTTVERSEAIAKKLKEILDIACKKVGCKKEVGLCRFLPSLSGGYMHHFTFQSMKVKDPAGLAELVHKLIIFTDFPKRLMPSDRKPRARKAGKELAHLSYEQVQKVRQLARNSNEPDLLTALSHGVSLKKRKKELIASIRSELIVESLWEDYKDAVVCEDARDHMVIPRGKIIIDMPED